MKSTIICSSVGFQNPYTTTLPSFCAATNVSFSHWAASELAAADVGVTGVAAGAAGAQAVARMVSNIPKARIQLMAFFNKTPSLRDVVQSDAESAVYRRQVNLLRR